MKYIATDIYTFENLLERDCVYVDKTKLIYDLIKGTASKQFFLSRPRRFGKSLLISTLQCIFEGKRELFEGLFLENADYDWQTYPVIRLDMNSTLADTVEGTENAVKNELSWQYKFHNVEFDAELPARDLFYNLIISLANSSSTGQVVVLIDEYDKPLLDNLGTEAVVPFQRFLKQFYGVVKTTERYQRFCFMTGVSKFSKVSIFSDLNNLRDITMDNRFCTICGYTHKEVDRYFPEHIDALAVENDISSQQAFELLCKMYDGYKFSDKCPRLFNPVTLGNCLIEKAFKSYWFETGTPGGLMNYLKTHPMDLSNYEISAEDLGTYDPVNPGTVPLLFQTGYLIIKELKGRPPFFSYVLDYPNLEVQAGFNRWLAKAYVQNDDANSNLATLLSIKCRDALESASIENFIDIIQQMFSAIPYELLDNANEHEYHALFHNMLYISASDVVSEVQTNLGRIDSVVQAGDNVYVIEFKLDKTADEALAQINERKYYEPYRQEDKQLILLGINFSTEKRNVDDYIAQKIDIEQ